MATSLQGVYVTEARIMEIREVADAWTLANGVSMKAGVTGDEHLKLVGVPYALFPSIVPKSLLQKGKSTMTHYSSLMHRVALDHEFLEESLKNVIEIDDFMSRLWDIYTQVRNKGIRQPLMLGLFRNDFMMEVKEGRKDDENLSGDQLELKQIELNTIAAGFGGPSTQTGHLHRLTLSMAGKAFSPEETPENTPQIEFSKALVRAWELYNNSKAVIIFLISQAEINTTDQRSLEFGVYYENPKIRVLRRTFLDFNIKGHLDDNGILTLDGDEVAVIYYRYGYTSENYTSEKDWDARLQMELSSAIKCPSIQHQLVGSKKIQQELARPGILERFIKDPQAVQLVRDTFAGQYSLDMGPEGDKNVNMALANPERFVLKPQREGGGHNLFDENITKFLEENRNSKERNAYTLMERIFPWEQKNYLVKKGVPFELSSVIGEIGIYGVFIGSTDLNEIENFECGHMMRTKTLDTAEGGICAGFAAVDSPFVTN